MLLSRDYWNALYRAITNGLVIPVIGANAIRFSDEENLSQYILRKICKMKGLNSYKNYDTLMYETGIKDNELHNLYYETMDNLTEEEIDHVIVHSKELIDLLEIKNFTLYLMLSPEEKIIERLLKVIWKNRIPKGYKSSLNFTDVVYGSYSKNIIKKDDLDIPKGWTGKYPFVVYLLGKSNECGFSKSFAITEDDIMFYVRKLIEPKIMPSRLSNKMKNKFFLFVGCDFSDWMFRFLYSAWRDIYGGKPGDRRDDDYIDSTLTLEDHNLQSSLAFDYFIKSVNLKIGENYKQFLPQLTNGFKDFMQSKADEYNLPPHIDVFLSYAHEDFEVVKFIYHVLEARGIQAWLDKVGDEENIVSNPNRILGLSSGENFPEVIRRAIKESTLFVPIISKHIIEATNDRYVFEEWSNAIDVYSQKIKRNPLVNFILGGFVYGNLDEYRNHVFDKEHPREKIKTRLLNAHLSIHNDERRKDFECYLKGVNFITDDNVKRKIVDIIINIEDLILKHG